MIKVCRSLCLLKKIWYFVFLDLLHITNENSNTEIEIHRLNETQHITSTTINDKPTPSRISYRTNPDGTRVSISRPPLPTNRQSPLLSSLRRVSKLGFIFFLI
jgi:hypothetical protein